MERLSLWPSGLYWAFAPFLLPAFGKASSQGWNPAEEIWFLKSHFDLFHFKESSFHARAPVWWPQTCTSGLWVWMGPLVSSFHPASRAQEMALGAPGEACERAGFNPLRPWPPAPKGALPFCLSSFAPFKFQYSKSFYCPVSILSKLALSQGMYVCVCVCVCVCACTRSCRSVIDDSLQPHGL